MSTGPTTLPEPGETAGRRPASADCPGCGTRGSGPSSPSSWSCRWPRSSRWQPSDSSPCGEGAFDATRLRVADRALHRRLGARPRICTRSGWRRPATWPTRSSGRTTTTCGSGPPHERIEDVPGRARPTRRGAGRRAGPAQGDRRPPADPGRAPARRCSTAGRCRSPRPSCGTASILTDLVAYGDTLAQLPGAGEPRRRPPRGGRVRPGQGRRRRGGGGRLHRADRRPASTRSSSPPSWPP